MKAKLAFLNFWTIFKIKETLSLKKEKLLWPFTSVKLLCGLGANYSGRRSLWQRTGGWYRGGKGLWQRTGGWKPMTRLIQGRGYDSGREAHYWGGKGLWQRTGGFLCAFRFFFFLWKRFFHFLIFGPFFCCFLFFFSFLLWPSTSVKLLWKRFFHFFDFWTIFCCFWFFFSFLLWPSTSVKLLCGLGANYSGRRSLWQRTGGWSGKAYDSGRGADYSGRGKPMTADGKLIQGRERLMTADGGLWQRTGSSLLGRERLMTADGGLFVCVSVFFLFMKAILSFFDFWTLTFWKVNA